MPPPALRAALAGLAALAVAMGVGRFAFTPLLPLMQDDAGLSLAAGGYLAAANYIGYFVGALWAARPARSSRAIHASLFAIALTTAAMGVAESIPWWLLLRFAAGVASACALVHVSAWALPRLAGGGLLYSGVGTGIALAGLVCLALMALGVSSAHAWLTLGALSLLVAACLWPIVRDGAAAPLLVPGAIGIVLAALLVGGTFMVITMAGLQEARAAGGAPLMAAMTAAFAAGQIAGPLVVSALARRPHGFALALGSAALLLL